MICSADLMYTILLFGLNFLALVVGSLRGEKKRREYSPLLIIRKPKHIFLNNQVGLSDPAYLFGHSLLQRASDEKMPEYWPY